MTEFYTAVQLVLFPIVVLVGIFGASLVAGAVITAGCGNVRKAAIKLILAAACTAAMWAYMMIPGGLV